MYLMKAHPRWEMQGSFMNSTLTSSHARLLSCLLAVRKWSQMLAKVPGRSAFRTAEMLISSFSCSEIGLHCTNSILVYLSRPGISVIQWFCYYLVKICYVLCSPNSVLWQSDRVWSLRKAHCEGLRALAKSPDTPVFSLSFRFSCILCPQSLAASRVQGLSANPLTC